MTPSRLLQAVLVTGLIAVAIPAAAGVYKCVAADGSLTYSQTPCPGQKTTTVTTVKSSNAGETLDCRHASQFALTVAKSMKRGRGSADLFSTYGGLEGLSKSAVNIINYVYQFRHSSDLSADRIAALTGNKCKARAFGEASCEAMPFAYIEKIGGCDEKDPDETQDPVEVAGAPTPAAENLATESLPMETLTAAPDMERSSQATSFDSNDQVASCKKRLQTQIDSINAQMRNGYSSQQGEQYRERLRALRKQMSDC